MAERLSSLQTMAEAGIPALQRAYDAIFTRRATQGDIRTLLNAELEEVGIAPVAASSFNRYVLKIRDGEIARPTLSATVDVSTGPVFDAAFRERLVQAVGEQAVLQLQRAMVALAGFGGRV